MRATEDKKKSLIALRYRPIVIDISFIHIWCAEDSIKEYWQYKKCSKCEHRAEGHNTCLSGECVK